MQHLKFPQNYAAFTVHAVAGLIKSVDGNAVDFSLVCQ